MKASWFGSWWRGSRRAKGAGARRQRAKCLPQVELLEARVVPSLTPHLVRDINFHVLDPLDLTAVGGALYFSTNNGLSRSDGTLAGTVLVGGGGGPTYLTNVNGTIFFVDGDSAHGVELWKSNGTAAGTVMVKDINPGPRGSYPKALTNINGTLFFQADDGTHGTELWRSNGSAAGTYMVADINPSGGSYPGGFIDVNGKIFFPDFPTGSPPAQLWRTDGTRAGTVLVKDVSPNYLTNINGTLFFQGNDGTHRATLAERWHGIWNCHDPGAPWPGRRGSVLPHERERHPLLLISRHEPRPGAVAQQRDGGGHFAGR